MAKYENYSRVSYTVMRELFDHTGDLGGVKFLNMSCYEGDEGGQVEVIAAEIPADDLEHFWQVVISEAGYAGRIADVVQAIRTYIELDDGDDGGTVMLAFPGFRWEGYLEDLIEGTATMEDGKPQVQVPGNTITAGKISASDAKVNMIETDEYEGGPVA